MSRRSIVVAALTVSLVAGCSGTADPPVTIDGAELDRITEHVGGVVAAHADAWAAEDVERILSFWDEETVHEDTGFNQLLTGDALFSMPRGFLDGFPDFRWLHLDLFVSRSVALDVTSGWGVRLKGIEFTGDDPLGEIDRVEVDADGTIGRWTLFYDLQAWESWSSPPSRIQDARDVIDAYRSAWEAGDRAALAALYADGAVRDDTLLHTGGSLPEIQAFAAALTTAYPSARLEPGIEFADSRQTSAAPGERIGSSFSLHLRPGADGCIIRFAVLLTVDGDRVSGEEVFWDAASLEACGWAG